MGFQDMDKEKLRAIARRASKKASAGRNRFTSKQAKAAGRKGGKVASHEAKVEAGRKGGLARAKNVRGRTKK
jgi:general stress protein YciG